METLICNSIEELDDIAKQIIELTKNHQVIAFYGSMGAGKTTLIKSICKKLGVADVVTSPTFSIANEYETVDKQTIYHFDFYRIKTEEEAMDLGYENYFFSKNLCLIEWPERIPNLLMLPHAKVSIVSEEEIRHFKIEV